MGQLRGLVRTVGDQQIVKVVNEVKHIRKAPEMRVFLLNQTV